MNKPNYLLSFLLLLMVSMVSHADISEPMYGNADNRNELAMQNAQFLAQATNTFGTREHASIGYVDSGFEAHLKNKNQLAMQRFNEAWLLNADNPYAYVGFGVLYKKQEEFCNAKKMFDLAAGKQLDEAGFLADYALIITQCGNQSGDRERQSLFTQANEIYARAEETPNATVLAYVYQSWAESFLLQNERDKASNMLEEAAALGATINPELAALINSPGQQP